MNSFANPLASAVLDVSTTPCEKFLHFFVDKVESVRVTSQNFMKDLSVARSAMFEHLVKSLKPTNRPLDVVPAKMLKGVFNTVAPGLLTFIDTCLSSGSVPAALKHAVLRPLLKKPHLDPTVQANFRPVSRLPSL